MRFLKVVMLGGEMMFIGNSLFQGGNGWPVKEARVERISVSGVEECKGV